MLNNFIDFFRSEEDQDPSFIRLTRNILLSVMAVNLAVLPLVSGLLGGDSRNIVAFIILTASLIIEGISLYFTYQGNIILAKVSVPLTLVVAITAIALNTNGVRDTSFLAIPVILTVSAMLLGRRSLALVTPAVVIAVLIVAYQDLTTHRIPRSIGIDDAIIVPILMVASAGITHLLIQRLNESIVRAQQSEQSQKRENEELLSLRASLEERVQARTVELEYANQTTEKRARQFRAVTQVMSAVSTIQALDELLPRITQVIGEQFNVYHVGVFLLDNKREYAVLRAANSDGGQRMLARKHALSIGQTGLVGFVTATGQARIALDVGADSIYFDNPDLPDTHSEIALPLRYAGQVIGALDVQSIEANAFQPDDVNALSTLADQVAVAINNALTIEEAQKALAEAQSAIGQVTTRSLASAAPRQIRAWFQLF